MDKESNQIHSNHIFLFGVMPRSGTNFIFRTILKHPAVKIAKPPGEDYLIYGIEHLDQYLEKVNSKWSSNWNGMNKELQVAKLRLSLVSGLYSYLQKDIDLDNNNYTISKTPRTDGLSNFRKYFPHSKLIILIRDGRHIIQSGVKSFKWMYIHSMMEYNESLKRIKSFIGEKPDNDYCLIKYEEFIKNPTLELKKIFKYLDLNDDTYDFSMINKMPVYGSSEQIDNSGNFIWKVKEKAISNNSLKKIDWHPLMNKRYNKICSEASRSFGYNVDLHSYDKSITALFKYLREELRELKRRLFYN